MASSFGKRDINGTISPKIPFVCWNSAEDSPLLFSSKEEVLYFARDVDRNDRYQTKEWLAYGSRQYSRVDTSETFELRLSKVYVDGDLGTLVESRAPLEIVIEDSNAADEVISTYGECVVTSKNINFEDSVLETLDIVCATKEVG